MATQARYVASACVSLTSLFYQTYGWLYADPFGSKSITQVVIIVGEPLLTGQSTRMFMGMCHTWSCTWLFKITLCFEGFNELLEPSGCFWHAVRPYSFDADIWSYQLTRVTTRVTATTPRALINYCISVCAGTQHWHVYGDCAYVHGDAIASCWIMIVNYVAIAIFFW